MNKRQYKKARKKVNKIIFDELVLLIYTSDYTPEEYKEFHKDIAEYSYRHHRFKHYKDKKCVIDFNYHPPVGKKSLEHFENTLKYVRKFPTV